MLVDDLALLSVPEGGNPAIYGAPTSCSIVAERCAYSARDATIVRGDHTLAAASGFADVYSGRDGTLLHSWIALERGAAPGRGAGGVDADGVDDRLLHEQRGRAAGGQDRALLRRHPGQAAHHHVDHGGRNLGSDAVGVGDGNRDRQPDLLASAAEGDTVYMIAGTSCRPHPGRC